MITLCFEISYNGTDWEKVPQHMYAITSNGVPIVNTLFFDSNMQRCYIRFVIDTTEQERVMP